MSGSFDLHKGIVIRWEADGLDWEHEKYWPAAERDNSLALWEAGTIPKEAPLPYTIFEISDSDVRYRMSGSTSTSKYHVRNIPVSFRTYAQESGVNDAKTVAKIIADLIMQKFGGHPTAAHKSIPLDNGSVILMQYQSDYGIAQDESVYAWFVNYIALVDVPVETG